MSTLRQNPDVINSSDKVHCFDPSVTNPLNVAVTCGMSNAKSSSDLSNQCYGGHRTQIFDNRECYSSYEKPTNIPFSVSSNLSASSNTYGSTQSNSNAVDLQNSRSSQISNTSHSYFQNGPSQNNPKTLLQNTSLLHQNLPPTVPLQNLAYANGPNSSTFLPQDTSRCSPNVSMQSSFNQVKFYHPPEFQQQQQQQSVLTSQLNQKEPMLNGKQTPLFRLPGNNEAVPLKTVPFTGPSGSTNDQGNAQAISSPFNAGLASSISPSALRIQTPPNVMDTQQKWSTSPFSQSCQSSETLDSNASSYGPNYIPHSQQLGYNQQSGFGSPPPNSTRLPHSYLSGPNLPEGPVGGITGYDPSLHAKMAGMSVHSSFSRIWGNESVNLLQDRNILPPVPLEPPKPTVLQDKQNCNPDIFRCTLTKIPESHSLLQKSRLPLGILIHPFKDIKQLPVVQCGTIVRCRSCRTYINPFVIFVDQRRWKCNLCFRINELPDEFLYDPTSKSYGDPSRRPEVRNATIEFIAPSEYMLRPPQPAVYLFLLDVSHSAIETGYLSVFCKILLEELDNLPGDARTQVGFITFDSSIHFYNLTEGFNQPHMLVVSDIDDVFLPSPDNLLVNLQENKNIIQDLLNDFPKRFTCNGDTNSALGAALQAGFKLMSPTGGRITVMQTCLPNYGPGALKLREDPNLRAGKDIANLGPANDFYKKLALDCSGQQIAVDLFVLSSQYSDIATLSCISKYSAGSVLYYPNFHVTQSPLQVEKFKNDFCRYLTRKIGFEAVMRIRCTRGLSIHTFHGNFFVRSTDLLSLPNVNPDAGFAMQIAIEDNLTDSNSVCFQAAVLYTSSRGERRIRVHTLSLPIVSILSDVLGGADQQAIIGLLAKMAVDRSLSSSISDAKEALINACIDLLNSFKITLSSGQTAGTLMTPFSARLMPLYVLGLLKHVAFRTGISTKLDERVFAMEQMKTLPLNNLLTYIYPNLYPIHNLDDKNALNEDGVLIPQPPLLQLSSEKIDRHGAYLLDTLDHMYIYVGRAISDLFCINVLGVANFNAIPYDIVHLPELKTAESERIRNFVNWLSLQRSFYSPIIIIREDSKSRQCFLQHMIDDRTESVFSYYEFLQHLKQQISK
ncbi:protein transport protein Sec24A [Centruroides vittatus]|uniref:protein transport protein Sec24A n=1 Tax=Centruroides vittatus TaxID=120091 RepID=UPI00350E91FA